MHHASLSIGKVECLPPQPLKAKRPARADRAEAERNAARDELAQARDRGGARRARGLLARLRAAWRGR